MSLNDVLAILVLISIVPVMLVLFGIAMWILDKLND